MLDPTLATAIEEVAAEMDQPPAVAQRLVAWLNQLCEGEPTREENLHFLENVRKVLDLGGAGHAN